MSDIEWGLRTPLWSIKPLSYGSDEERARADNEVAGGVVVHRAVGLWVEDEATE